MSQQARAVIVVAHIAEAIQPIARGTKYEDPLEAALKGAGLGSVNGGGSLLSAQLQVASADIELALRDLNGALQFARTTLLTLGAPAGSLLLFLRDGRPRALDIATGKEFDHQPAMDALERRLALSGVDDDDECPCFLTHAYLPIAGLIAVLADAIRAVGSLLLPTASVL